MGRSRKYGEDLTYAEEHRRQLPQLYNRIGHRLDLANRDWTEFCHYCKEPLSIIEEVQDRGQDLLDKGITVTSKLARSANLPGFLLGWRNERPPEVDDEINRLNGQVRELESLHPITGFKVRNLRRYNRELIDVTPPQWWEFVLLLHREHHHQCQRINEFPVNGARLLNAKSTHPLTEVDLLDLLKFEGGNTRNGVVLRR